MHRLGLAVALVAICACGNKDKSSEGGDDPGAAIAKAMGMPSGATITADGKQAKALTDNAVDWTKIETSKDEPPATETKVDPTSITTDGIASAPVAGFAQVKATGFRVAYAPTQKYDNFRQAFMQEQLFENVAAMLNKTIKMPRVVDIQLVECGTVNAFYDPNHSRIIMCYELMDYYTKMFQPVSKSNEELGNSIVGATFFAFFHELGHGLIHQLDLPAVGREEDAVDQMATLILMEDGDNGVSWAMAGARWFAMQSEENEKSGQKMPFWDEHSLEGQRFYNISCIVFGSNPEKYAPMVKNGYLPEPRAMRCPDEYAKISHAWERLLEPHFKKPEGGETPVADNTGNQPQVPSEPAPPTGGEPQAPPANDPMAPKPLPGGGGGSQPTSGGLSCETVIDHALEVVVAELMKQAEQQGPDMVAQVEEQLRSNGPLIRQAGIQECQTKNWTPAQRACVMKGTSIATIDGCDIQ